MKKGLLLTVLIIIVSSIVGCQKSYYNPTHDDGVTQAKITIQDNTLKLQVGDVRKFNYKITPDKYKDMPVKISSSDVKVVSIGKNGIIIAEKEGEATVTIKTEDEKDSEECKIVVIPFKKAIISGNVPSSSNAGATYIVNVKFENCSYPSVKVIADCGGGKVTANNGTDTFNNTPQQLKVSGDTKISFAISGQKDVNNIRILCFDEGELIDMKEYNIILVRENKEN